MAKNNDIYFNAALSGFIRGSLDGRKPLTSITAVLAAAVVFADKVDNNIANDALVSNAGGLQLEPTTATIAADEQWRASVLHDLCAAATSGRYFTSTTPSDYSSLATQIATDWAVVVASLVTP
jgi:hypothetical protein